MTVQVLELERENSATIARAFDAWAARTGGPFELLAPDATWTIVGNSPVSRTYTSRDEFLEEVIGPFNARMAEPLIPTVRRLYADGDTVIAFFDAKGVAKDGQPYNNTYTWYLRMQDGLIVEATAFFDTIEFTDFCDQGRPLALASDYRRACRRAVIRSALIRQ